MTKEEQITEIWNCLQTENTIECENCDEFDVLDGNDNYAAEQFYKRGWRYYAEKALCPKCVKKIKK